MRKLATASLSFSAAVFLAAYILPGTWLLPVALIFALLGLSIALMRRKWLRPAVVALSFFALGLAEYALYSRATLAQAHALDGQTEEIYAVALDYPDDYPGYCRFPVRITGKNQPHFKALVYDGKKAFADIEPGQSLCFTARISAADVRYGKPYDNDLSNGIYMRLNIKGEGKILSDSRTLGSLPVYLRHSLCRRVDSIFPEDAAAFVKALMLGEKQAFYEDDGLYVSMSRAGLMHVAAVSGLHIAFLVGVLLFVFGRGKRGALICILLVWCFVLVRGCSKWAVRAAVMQTFLLLAPLLRRENDPLTSLSAALAMILVFCPFAAKSVSLQMSFGAMAGILCLSERLTRLLTPKTDEGGRRGPLAYAVGVLASSLSVTAFTMPLTAIHFSYVQVLSVFSNLLCLWAVSCCFCLAWIACALPFFGAWIAWLCTWLVRYIRFCAELIASVPFAVLYMQTRGAGLWILASYILILSGALFRRRRLARILLPGALSLALLAGLLLYTYRYYREHDIFTVLNVGQGQCICAMTGEETIVVDCGNISNPDPAGTLAGEYLLSCGRNSIQVLMLTHLHSDHADGAVRLMEMLPTETLVLPADAEDSAELREEILSCAERHGTQVLELDCPARVSTGRIGMQIYRIEGGNQGNERCLMARLTIGDTDLLVTADATQRVEKALARQEALENIDILIAGHHGAADACSESLLGEIGGRIAVVSTGYNTYGHPAEETLERLGAFGFRVFRTDLDGNVEIQAEREHG